MSIVSVDPTTARDKFLKKPFMLQHGLINHPLFDLSKLVELAQSMPRDRIEYNSGKVAIGVKPDDVPTISLAPAEVVKTIETANAWMVIKNVEERAEYRALLEQFVTDANIAAGRKPGEFSDLQGFIFVSSANSTTPFHVDAEENILIQIKGDKLFTTFDNDDRSLVSEEALEISPSKHRNQTFDESFNLRATLHTMKPGDALHVPYYTPHWVGTGDTYSISMAMTWKTPEVLRLNKIRLMNGTLRRFGMPQKPPGVSPVLDAAKVLVHDGVRLVIEPIRKWEGARRALRGLIYGKKANYYYGDKQQQAGM
jgi:ribosomal protein L16 Arg81 hydroxylase